MDPLVIPGIFLAAILFGKKKKPPEEEVPEVVEEAPEAAVAPSVVSPAAFQAALTAARGTVPSGAPSITAAPPPPAPKPTMPPPPPPPSPTTSPVPVTGAAATYPVPITTYTPPAPPPETKLPTGPTTNPPTGEYEWGTVVRHPQAGQIQFAPNPVRFKMKNQDGRAVDVTFPDSSWNIIAADGRGWFIENVVPGMSGMGSFLSLAAFG